MENLLGYVFEAENLETQVFFKSIQRHRLIYAKYRGGRVVKALYEEIA
jgi:hypothetical protein